MKVEAEICIPTYAEETLAFFNEPTIRLEWWMNEILI